MKFFGPIMYGVTAAVACFLSTIFSAVPSAILLLIGLFLWVLFIVYMLRAIRPE